VPLADHLGGVTGSLKQGRNRDFTGIQPFAVSGKSTACPSKLPKSMR
jgi:hypothetical protein